jgi:hypothetical protein
MILFFADAHVVILVTFHKCEVFFLQVNFICLLKVHIISFMSMCATGLSAVQYLVVVQNPMIECFAFTCKLTMLDRSDK